MKDKKTANNVKKKNYKENERFQSLYSIVSGV